MKLKHSPLLLLFFPIICLAEFKSGNELKTICNESDAFSRGNCLGYITAVVDTFNQKSFCPPSTVTAGQVESISKKYLNEYPERLHFSADSLVKDAMSRAFPCSGKRQP